MRVGTTRPPGLIACVLQYDDGCHFATISQRAFSFSPPLLTMYELPSPGTSGSSFWAKVRKEDGAGGEVQSGTSAGFGALFDENADADDEAVPAQAVEDTPENRAADEAVKAATLAQAERRKVRKKRVCSRFRALRAAASRSGADRSAARRGRGARAAWPVGSARSGGGAAAHPVLQSGA
jgi:hypothetical protein